MAHSLNPFGLLLSVGVAGLTLGPVSAAFASYTYSPTLISRYTAGCSEKMTATGKTPEQAAKLCQCSIQQMQAQHSQTQAIIILTKAQFSFSTDPQTGLPTALSKYFATCTS